MYLFFDLETTGPDHRVDRIIQVSIVGDNLVYDKLVNPIRAIPPEVTSITKISNADVANAPPFVDIAKEVAQILAGNTLVGFGCHNFDVPLLDREFHLAGIPFVWPNVIDAGELFKIFAPRTLSAALKHYCDTEHTDAHRGLSDAYAVQRVFLAQLEVHRENLAGLSPEAMSTKSRYGKRFADPSGVLAFNDDGHLCYNTRRNRGVRIVDDPGYAEWMLRGDFLESTKRMLRDELQRMTDQSFEALI